MSLVTKAYIFDLAPGNSFAEQLLDRGFDVFLLDWGIPDAVDSANTLETYCDAYLPRAANAAVGLAGSDDVTVFGYCLGGILSLLFVAGHPDAPVRNLVVQATPLDFSQTGPTAHLIRAGRLDPDDMIDETGNVPPAVMHNALRLSTPTGDISSYADFWQHAHDDNFIAAYQALIGWARDHIPFPGATCQQIADLFIRRDLLTLGSVPLGGRTVHISDISCPVLNIVGDKDDIVLPASTEPIKQLIPDHLRTDLVLPAGHIGLIVGQQAKRRFIPRMLEWIEAHSEHIEEPPWTSTP